MSELEPLSEAARAAITDELRAPSGDPVMRARVAGKLEAALGAAFAATAVAGAASAAAPSAAAPAAKGAVALSHGKLAALVAVTAMSGAAAGVSVDRALHPRTEVVAPTPSVIVPPPVVSIVPSPPASLSSEPTVTASASVTAAPSAKPIPEPEGDLARERALIDAARAGLKHGNAAAALDAVQRHAKSFPHGQLREEREGIRILALAALGRKDEAKTWDAKFKTAYPDSLFRPQIDAALGNAP